MITYSITIDGKSYDFVLTLKKSGSLKEQTIEFYLYFPKSYQSKFKSDVSDRYGNPTKVFLTGGFFVYEDGILHLENWRNAASNIQMNKNISESETQAFKGLGLRILCRGIQFAKGELGLSNSTKVTTFPEISETRGNLIKYYEKIGFYGKESGKLYSDIGTLIKSCGDKEQSKDSFETVAKPRIEAKRRTNRDPKPTKKIQKKRMVKSKIAKKKPKTTVINPLTKRRIAKNGSLYKRLVKDGVITI